MQELDHLGAFDGAWEQAKVEATRADAGDHRQLVPIEMILQDRGLTFGRPGLDPRGSLAQSRLVDEDDDPGLVAYSAEDDRLFRRNVTGDSAERALAGFSTLAGHVRSRFWVFDGRDRHCLLLASVLGFGAFLGSRSLAHRFLRFQMDSMRAMSEAVEDGVGQRGIADVVMPLADGQLARDDASTIADSVVAQLEQIIALSRSDGRDGKVVDQQDVDLGDGGKTLAEAAIGVTEIEFL